MVAVLNDAGQLSERVEYSPYGVARHYAISDFNGSGDSTTQDIFDFLAAWYAGGTTPPNGITRPYTSGAGLNAPDSPIGYCGYLFNKETQNCVMKIR